MSDAVPQEPRDDSIGHIERARDASTGRYVSKLTQEVHDTIVRAVRNGAPQQAAAAYAGVWRTTYTDWLSIGRRQLAEANGNVHAVLAESPHARLAYDVDKADASFIVQCMAELSSAGRNGSKGDWRALAWQLERRFPGMFGKQMLHQHAGKIELEHDHFITVRVPPGNFELLTAEELAMLRALLGKVGGGISDSQALELEA